MPLTVPLTTLVEHAGLNRQMKVMPKTKIVRFIRIRSISIFSSGWLKHSHARLYCEEQLRLLHLKLASKLEACPVPTLLAFRLIDEVIDVILTWLEISGVRGTQQIFAAFDSRELVA